jgi:hypothetical protein
MNQVEEIKLQFYKFLDSQLTIEEIESWIYESPFLEEFLGNDHYIDLISYNFKNKCARDYIQSIVTKFLSLTEYENWRTVNLLTEITKGNIEIVLASRKLRQLYKDQEETLETPLLSIGLAIGYESELDNCPIESEYHQWNKEQLKKQLEPVDWYKLDFLEDVLKELNKLIEEKSG